MVRGRQDATGGKGNSREGACEGEEDRRLKKENSVYIVTHI